MVSFIFLNLAGCETNNNQLKNVVSVKIGGLVKYKEIKNNNDKKEILNQLNALQISGTRESANAGIGYSVTIEYSEKSFIRTKYYALLGDTMGYYALDKNGQMYDLNNNKIQKATIYNIDKNLTDLLINIYNKD